METLQSAIAAMRPNCFFASADLPEAYYSIPIFREHRTYFRFLYNGRKFQFTAIVMGLSSSPGIFTKILKPVLPKFLNLYLQFQDLSPCECGLHSWSLSSRSKLWQLFRKCYWHCDLKDDLGLTLKPEKLVLTPNKSIVSLGFIFLFNYYDCKTHSKSMSGNYWVMHRVVKDKTYNN